MKKIIFILLFVLSMFSFSQETNKIAEQQFLDYNQLIANKNFEKAIDRYAPEEFLKIFPKDMLIKTFEQLFNNPKMKFTLYSPIINKTEMQNKRINKISYGKIFYIQKMEVELEDITILKKDDEKKSKINSYLNIFKSQFGEKNATYNEVNSKFEIIAHKQAIAISSDEKDWKFIIAEKKQEQILKNFIPQELLNDLK